jgi:3',5'-cyclic AMP phosphodiesterase CpdA
MVRVLQISDTHLSPTKRHFDCNWPPLQRWVEAQRPDLIIHTGDVTVDGADHEADMAHCAPLLRALPAPVLCVPGNHDVGEPRHPHQAVNAERIARWRRHFGPDYWSHDVEGWRLVGLDAMLFGSGLAEEAEQLAWLEACMNQAQGRPVAWFMHQPLFLAAPDEGDTGYWSVKPTARTALLDIVRRHPVAIVATGHLHRSYERHVEATRYVWGPSSGFVVGPAFQDGMAGESRLGAVVYEFSGTGAEVRIVDVEGLETLWIDDVIHEVYPPRQAA